MSVPFLKSWWVVPGKLLAGCYPGDPNPAEAKRKLACLLASGIRSIVCLQEPDEKGGGGQAFVPYEGPLLELAREQGVDIRLLRFPIQDSSVPTPRVMNDILDAIDAAIGQERSAYVHCWGGHGRTATVVGCWLVRHGLSGEDALHRVRELRRKHPELQHEPAPQTQGQCAMVRNWGGGSQASK